ncbi:M48 family metallopeptidase [Actinocrinis puniceicyclus]|uniref:M48 family metallopeptidase n=1 Tax=Actinocrinis puniceicyclus TaxID=977794 RepID=A0A8J7WQB5_9ACTN|nr:SprT family zinc-dependent metalloprotease [Actinocrinis puniceicyclus]MBS2963962.1 M48 family metallopeptidase [Actinocrinis puniceicyclus]
MNSPEAADSLRIGDLEIEVAVSTRRRTVRLTVERDARIVAAVPPGLSREKLEALLKARTGWIYSKLGEREAAVAVRPVKEFVSGEGFHYLGRSYRLKVVDTAPAPVGLVQGRLLLRRDRIDVAEDDLIAWYRARGQEWLPQRVMPWAERMRAPLSEITVRRLGYRWGSCSSTGGVNIHWATMQLPVALVDYVLVHELAHLHQSGHPPAFWRIVGRAMPDFGTRRAALDGFGAQLWLPE